MNREATVKISAYLPSGILTNEELAELYPGWTADKIREKTGIHSRHASGDDKTAGDLGEKAVKGGAECDVYLLFMDSVLYATHSPEYWLKTACLCKSG